MKARSRGEGRGSGKVILLGEHSVVYGRPAIAAGIGTGATAIAESATETTLHVRPWEVRVAPAPASGDGREAGSSLARALGALLDAASITEPLRLEAEVLLPGGSGLGSSAALGTAVLRAIDGHLGIERSEGDALEITLAWERVFHGNPSGVDNALAWAGGLAWFVRGTPLTRIRARHPIRLVIGSSGEPCSTSITVGQIARQHEKDRERMEKQFDAIAAIVRNGKLVIEAGDHKALGQLFDMNQSLLAGMLISTDTLEDMIRAARDAGALGAKLTGGGGGGCMIAVVKSDEDATRVQGAIRGIGKDAFVTTIGAPS
jgi:mevalonate kinase